MKSFKSIIFRLLIAVLFSLPVYLLLEQNVLKHIVDYKIEKLAEMDGNLSDIDTDGFSEVYYFYNISDEQVYLEMWSKGSLLGVWTKPGKLINHSVIMDQRADKKEARLFFLTQTDKKIYINELTLKIEGRKLSTVYETTLLVINSANADTEFLQKKMLDLNDDGANEYVFSISEALDIRCIVAYNYNSNQLTKSATDFMMLTDFFMLNHPAGKKLAFTSYSNGNVSEKNIQRVVKDFDLDTALCTHFYTDLKSYAGVFDKDLKVEEIKMERKGFTSMYRIVPIRQDNKQRYIAISTFINEPDSLPQIFLLDEQLKVLQSKSTALPVPQEMFNKYRKELLFVKEGKNQEEDRAYLIGQNDTIYELLKDLTLSPLVFTKNTNDKSKLAFIDLDDDGKEEIILCGMNGATIYQSNFKDPVSIEARGFSFFKKDHFSRKNEGKKEWQFITDTNHHLTLTYVSNPFFYWKAPFFIGSILLMFSLLSFLLWLNGRKIEKEKKRLEVLVMERTKDAVDQKLIAENRRELIEEKQKEIIDSINYAKRIQSAIMAKEEDIKTAFPDSFLLYKPKDIVAGDFYFFENTSTHLFYAAADCTGHGVPGALVSVVCANALSRCVKEFGLTMPGEILDKARTLVEETFRKSGQDVKDGMDISLLVKDKKQNTFHWAGANNALWYIASQGSTLNEIKANKQPIGISENPKPFTTHALQVQPNTCIYLLTDGYADQFGGEKGKKFKYKQLSEKLLTISQEPMENQKQILDNCFEGWKGSLEQIDDVCIIGIRL
ncbi:MAG TPA: SpoIIE family protein phosphatase [Bacteroidia bacterium]